ncbi:hypothetical protein I4U23_000451 [Adineta vaga]|nr:hypothetical protein I4U23_000451 [Adineta vaga]
MSNSICSHDNPKVKHIVTLFEEVQNRYVNKLLSINDKHIITNEERYKQKIVIYESYVKDLSLQIRLLLQSIDELEKEANQRVELLETKLKKANVSSKHHHSFTDLSKTVSNFETEKWKLTHENLDLKHDLNTLISFINIAKHTGKWSSNQLQLKTLSLDCLVGINNEKHRSLVPIHKEIQSRDERIQILQEENDHLRKLQTDLSKQLSKLPSLLVDNVSKEKNHMLSKKFDDLRSKLAEECQKSETFKIDIHSKTIQIKTLQEELNQKKQQYEEHIHDLSMKLKTISDRHRESTTMINNDNKIKNQQIDQLTQQIEQIRTERNELHRQSCVKDTNIADLQVKIQGLERPILLPSEPTVPKTEYEKLNNELQTTRKQIESLMNEIQTTDELNCKLEQDLRLFKKFHDEQFEQQIKTSATTIDQLQTEIRTLKQNCVEKIDEFYQQSLELRTCQEHLSFEQNKNRTTEQEKQQLSHCLQNSNEKLEKSLNDIKQNSIRNDQYEQTINEYQSRMNLFENKLIETMKLVDLRNKTLLNNEDQIEQFQNDLVNKQKDILEKETRIEQLEQNLTTKTNELLQLTEKYQEKEKLSEENSIKTSNSIKNLQQKVEHLSASLMDCEHTITTLNEQCQKLNNDFRIKQEEFHQIEKSLNKQLNIKQDQLVRYDQNLHEAEIQYKYAQEECLIQEKEIARLNLIQEEQENKMKILQQDLLKTQEQKDFLSIQYERCEIDLQNMKHHREDEIRTYNQEFDKINNELTSLRIIEVTLLKNIDELKENLLIISNERDQIHQQYNNYHNNLEDIQQILYDETESNSKSQSRSINQDYLNKENELKQNLNRTKSLIDERNRLSDERQREIETLKHLMSHLEIDYDKSKNDLSINRDRILHLEIENETIRKDFIDKTNEIMILTKQLQQNQYDFHLYEKDHRYSNEEYFQHEQTKKSIENEFTIMNHNYEKLQKDYQNLNESFKKCRYELEQREKSDCLHKERLIQSMDGGKIYKQKLVLLGECFKTIIRKASETSEQWVDLITHLDELITDLSNEIDRFHLLGEHFQQSTNISTQLRVQYEDLISQFLMLKSNVEKIHLYLRKSKQKSFQINEENLHLHIEIKRLREKIENYHRVENLMHTKTNEQEIGLNQLRKDLNSEFQGRLEVQRINEQLKHAIDEMTIERNQLIKTMNNAQKQFEKEISTYANEKCLLQETIDKLEEQLHIQSQSLEQSYQDKIYECESLLISLTESHKNLLEEKTLQLDTAQSKIDSLKHEHSSKMEKFEETSQEFQRHIFVLEQSIEEHKHSIRKLEKELEDITLNSSSNSTICTKHGTEISFLRMENASLNEQIRFIQENSHRSQSLHFLSNGISDICINDVNNNETSQSCIVPNVMNEQDNVKQKEALWFPFVQHLACNLNDQLSSQKKYKLMKAYSKQQQFLLNQLEAQIQFYESIFQQHCLPAIECLPSSSELHNTNH